MSADNKMLVHDNPENPGERLAQGRLNLKSWRPPAAEAIDAIMKMQAGGSAPALDELKELMLQTLSTQSRGERNDNGTVGAEPLHHRQLAGDAGAALRLRGRCRSDDDDSVSCLHRTREANDCHWDRDVFTRLVNTLPAELLAVMKHPALWQRWLVKLNAKGYFADAPVCSEEHDRRVKAAMVRFGACIAHKLDQTLASASVAGASPLQKEIVLKRDSLPRVTGCAPSVRARSTHYRPMQPNLYNLVELD